MKNNLTYQDLAALKALVNAYKVGETFAVSNIPELERRWAFITPFLEEYGFRFCNIAHDSISFVGEGSFKAFAAHVDDWLEKASYERELLTAQIDAAKTTRFSALATVISALCALISLAVSVAISLR